MNVVLVKPVSCKQPSQSKSQSLQNRLNEQLEATIKLVTDQLQSAGVDNISSFYYDIEKQEIATNTLDNDISGAITISIEDSPSRTDRGNYRVLSTAVLEEELHNTDFFIQFIDSENDRTITKYMANLFSKNNKIKSLTLYPCYPFSLLQNELGYFFDIEDLQCASTAKAQRIGHTDKLANLDKSIPPANSYYLQFEPVSSDLIYQHQALATAIVIAPASIVKAITSDLIKNLNRVKNISALFLLTNHPELVSEIPDRIKMTISDTRSIDYPSALSMLSKSKLSLTVGNGLYADACRLNVSHIRYDNPVECEIKSDLQPQTGQTLHQLEEQIAIGINEGYILQNHPDAMAALLNQWMGLDINMIISDGTDTETIIPWPSKISSVNKVNGFLNSLSSRKRKIIKFRESPKRFFRDSQHPLLVYFK